MDTARKLLVAVMLSSGAALAERPPLQSDFDRCTYAIQSNGRDASLQGRVRLELLIRPEGRPYAAFVRSETGITDRQLERCLTSLPMLWDDFAKSTLDYVWPYQLSFVPGGERIAGGQTPLLDMNFLSKQADLKPGQKVYTSGVGGVFPSGLLVGAVKAFKVRALDGQAQVTPAVDLSHLEDVFVVTGRK